MACGPATPMKIRTSRDLSLGPDLFRFSFYAFLGWQNEQDHYDVMKKESYSEFRGTFKDCINPDKGVKIYHAGLTKVYGEW